MKELSAMFCALKGATFTPVPEQPAEAGDDKTLAYPEPVPVS
jgi:hypothetical protein